MFLSRLLWKGKGEGSGGREGKGGKKTDRPLTRDAKHYRNSLAQNSKHAPNKWTHNKVYEDTENGA